MMNTRQSIPILTTALIVLGGAFCARPDISHAQPPLPGQASAVQRSPMAGQLNGTWRMIATRQSGASTISDVPQERQTKLKLITTGHYVWYVYNPDTKEIAESLSGTCSLDGGTYEETAQYGSYPSLLGKSQHFTVKLEGDRMHLWGTLKMGGDNPSTRPLEEVWKRVK